MTTEVEFLDGRKVILKGVNRYNHTEFTIPGDQGGTVRDYGMFASISSEAGNIELGGGTLDTDEISGEEAKLGPVRRIVFTSDAPAE